jgi:DNA-binding HxlR family transcriptional regulator
MREDDEGVRSYGQYCPIARASEILAERWTPLVVRNLMFGADTFSQIARGVPSMSRSMLATRLRELERAGLLERTEPYAGRGARYLLTPAGRDLAGVLTALADWGERWVEVGPEHTDPGFALWAWCLVQLDRTRLPPGRVVVAFDFVDQPPGNRHYWLLVEHGDAEVCYTDPGDEPALHVEAESAAFVDWHRGRLSWASAVRSGRMVVAGDRRLASALPRWNLREPRLTA